MKAAQFKKYADKAVDLKSIDETRLLHMVLGWLKVQGWKGRNEDNLRAFLADEIDKALGEKK